MILGLGCDLIEIARVEKAAREERFLVHLYRGGTAAVGGKRGFSRRLFCCQGSGREVLRDGVPGD